MRLPSREPATRWDEDATALERSWAPWARADGPFFALFAAGAAWSYLAAVVSGGDAAPVAGLFLVSGAVLAVARAATIVSPSLVPVLILGTGLALLVNSGAETFSKHSLSGPFGYSNASGAFFVQATMAALMLSTVARRRPTKVAAVLAAVAFAVVPIAVGSRAAALLVLSLPLIAFAVQQARGARAAVTGCAVLVAVSLTMTSLLAAWYSDDARSASADRVIEEVLSDRRLLLWHEAFALMKQHPEAGVGPGRFDEVSPVARFNRDTRWAHHGFLQQGAEAGIPGVVLLMLLFAWAFVRLRASANVNPAAVSAAVAVAALGINACFDYVLHFAAIPITTAALVGAATVGRQLEEREA